MGRPLTDFQELGLLRRIQARSRRKALELELLERDLPREGLLLDLGCGQGIAVEWLARRSSSATVIGVDLDEEKIAQARNLAANLPNVRFVASRFEEYLSAIAPGSVAGVLLADVLSSMPHADQDALFRRLPEIVGPGGRAVILFVDTRPRLRAAANAVRSWIVCHVLRLSRSAGARFFYRSRADLRARLEAAGFDVVRDEPRRGFAPMRRLVAERRQR